MVWKAGEIVSTASRRCARRLRKNIKTGFSNKKAQGRIEHPPTGLSRVWRSYFLRSFQRALEHQRYYSADSAPSGGITSTTTPMARRYARWRIHRKPPSWLRPRRETAHSLPSNLNVGHWKMRVKAADNFLGEPGTTAASGIPPSVSVNTAIGATHLRMIRAWFAPDGMLRLVTLPL
jgi:hypothetical protein